MKSSKIDQIMTICCSAYVNPNWLKKVTQNKAEKTNEKDFKVTVKNEQKSLKTNNEEFLR